MLLPPTSRSCSAMCGSSASATVFANGVAAGSARTHQRSHGVAVVSAACPCHAFGWQQRLRRDDARAGMACLHRRIPREIADAMIRLRRPRTRATSPFLESTFDSCAYRSRHDKSCLRVLVNPRAELAVGMRRGSLVISYSSCACGSTPLTAAVIVDKPVGQRHRASLKRSIVGDRLPCEVRGAGGSELPVTQV